MPRGARRSRQRRSRVAQRHGGRGAVGQRLGRGRACLKCADGREAGSGRSATRQLCGGSLMRSTKGGRDNGPPKSGADPTSQSTPAPRPCWWAGCARNCQLRLHTRRKALVLHRSSRVRIRTPRESESGERFSGDPRLGCWARAPTTSPELTPTREAWRSEGLRVKRDKSPSAGSHVPLDHPSIALFEPL